VGGLFRDVMRPFDTYFSNDEVEAGQLIGRSDAASSPTVLRDGAMRRNAVRRVPETVSAHG
jgi:hypothetical protein